MNSRVFILACALATNCTLCACQSENHNLHKLDKICSEMQEISKMTDDCDKMAQKFIPVSKKMNAIVLNFQNSSPNQEQIQHFRDGLTKCTSAFAEIALGTCRDNKNIQTALREHNDFH